VLDPLSLVLNQVLREKDEVFDLVLGRIVNIFLIFSQSETYVKEAVAESKVMKREFCQCICLCIMLTRS
jgi:hypothetical protein